MLVECDVCRDMDTTSGRSKAEIPLLMRGIPQEKCPTGPWAELVSGGSVKVNITDATKYPRG